MDDNILVEVAYATPSKQMILECEARKGTVPREVVKNSGISRYFPEINLDNCELGVFGKSIAEDYRLSAGDRIEIYRPLIADPKEIRRQRAERGLKTRKGGGAINPD